MVAASRGGWEICCEYGRKYPRLAVAEPIDAAIAALAGRQHGNVTRTQLLHLGLGPSAIVYRVKTGRLFAVHIGVYAIGRRPVTPLEHATAAVLACGPEAALSHRSAAILWGFVKGRLTAPFDVTVPGDRRPQGIRVHRSIVLTWRDLGRHFGIRVTSPARTLLDCAPALKDKPLTRAVNEALLSPYLRMGELADVIERFPRHPGAARLAAFIERPGRGLTRSDLEDAFVAFCERFGLPRPATNVMLAGYEVDALFAPEKLIVELDSYEFHSDRTAFENDRNRDADTLLAGYQTIRVTWERLKENPRREAARLDAILAGRRKKAA